MNNTQIYTINEEQIKTRVTAALDYLLNQFTGLEYRLCDWHEAFAATDVVSYEEGYSYYSDHTPEQLADYAAQCMSYQNPWT